MFQLILESDLNKIAPLTTATVLAGLVIICLSGVSGVGTSHHFFHVPRRGGDCTCQILLLVIWGLGECAPHGVWVC